MKKKILPAVCVMCICVMLLTSCAVESEVSEPSNLDFLNKTSSNQPNEEDFPVATDDYKNYIQKANVVEGEAPVSFKNVEYSNIEISKSKKLLHGIKKEDVDYMNDGTGAKIDKDGRILDDKTYLYLTVRITNKKNEEMLIPLQVMVVELDKELSYSVCLISNIYRSGKPLGTLNSPQGRKNYYMQVFQPKESTVYTLAAIVNDDIIDSDSLYFILGGYYTDSDRQEANFQLEEDKAYKIN